MTTCERGRSASGARGILWACLFLLQPLFVPVGMAWGAETESATSDTASEPPPEPSPGPSPEINARSGTPLRLVLVGGEVREGYFVTVQQDSLRFADGSDIQSVDLALVEQIVIDGTPVSPEQLREAVEALLEERSHDDLPRPAPATVAVLSVLWPGAGHLALGKKGTFWGYSAVEAVFLGVGAYLLYEEEYGQMVPIAFLDLMFRAYAADDAARTARRRRLFLTVHPVGDTTGVMMGITFGADPGRPEPRAGRMSGVRKGP